MNTSAGAGAVAVAADGATAATAGSGVVAALAAVAACDRADDTLLSLLTAFKEVQAERVFRYLQLERAFRSYFAAEAGARGPAQGRAYAAAVQSCTAAFQALAGAAGELLQRLVVLGAAEGAVAPEVREAVLIVRSLQASEQEKLRPSIQTSWTARNCSGMEADSQTS